MPASELYAVHLLDPKVSVAARTRAIFGLKGLNTPAAVCALEKSLLSDPSALVRHEVAYVLGQMGAVSALPTLTQVLHDEGEDVMVRHEAAEAMGAIGDTGVTGVLRRYADDASAARELRETCVLALARLAWHAEGEHDAEGQFGSVDPAPAVGGAVETKVLRERLCDEGLGLFERYKAMFALRNRGGEESVLALCEAMESERGSALFRHEVAYVLGQMQDARSVPALARVLGNLGESEMVRHEAAEALGSVGTKEADMVLDGFRKDEKDAVRESVEVALDISDYVTGADLHYAEKVAVER